MNNLSTLQGFESVRVSKQRLKEAITDNLNAHTQEYEAAMEGFKAEWRSRLTKELGSLETDTCPEDITAQLTLPKPRLHGGDYYSVLATVHRPSRRFL